MCKFLHMDIILKSNSEVRPICEAENSTQCQKTLEIWEDLSQGITNDSF